LSFGSYSGKVSKTDAGVTMNTLGMAIKDMAEVNASIGIGTENGKMAVKVELGDAVFYWSSNNARKMALQWINTSINQEDMGGVSALVLKINELEVLISPDALLQGGVDMLTAAGVLSGIGVAHNWLEDTHGFGIDVEAVCASIQPKDELAETPEALAS
jgi:hypothetical protein